MASRNKKGKNAQDAVQEQQEVLVPVDDATPTELEPPFTPDEPKDETVVISGGEVASETEGEILAKEAAPEEPTEKVEEAGDTEPTPVDLSIQSDSEDPIVLRSIAIADRALGKIEEYAEVMSRAANTDRETVMRQQVVLYTSTVNILTIPDDSVAVDAIGKLLDIYHANAEDCFSPALRGRYIDELKTIDSTKRGFLNLITTLLASIANKDTRHAEMKKTNPSVIVKFIDAEKGELIVSRLKRICNVQ